MFKGFTRIDQISIHRGVNCHNPHWAYVLEFVIKFVIGGVDEVFTKKRTAFLQSFFL